MQRCFVTAFWLFSGVSVVMAMTSATVGAAEYTLAPGDVVEFSVAGAPDMLRRTPIDVDGKVSLPLVGEVPAAGITISALRAQVRTLMSAKEYHQHAGEGTHSADIVWPDQIAIDITEYRPIYLNGDVAKPGEQKFRPGLTVRQALSLAGGYDILRFRMENPFIAAAELRASYESTWIEFARERARLDRIHGELGKAANGAPAKSDPALEPPLPSLLLDQIKRAENDLRSARDEDFVQQHAHVQTMLAQDDQNISVLTKRRDAEASGSQYDEIEFNRIQDVYKMGTMPMTRVAEARRVMLLSATQALQSAVELERAKTDREVRKREAETLNNHRQVDLLKEEQESQTKLADIRVRILAIGDKLLYVGTLKTQLARGSGERPDLVLFRKGAPGTRVAEDAELQPGDVVEVALHVGGALGATSTMR